MARPQYKYGETLKHRVKGDIIFRGYHTGEDFLYTLKHTDVSALRVGSLDAIIVTPKVVDECAPKPLVGRAYRSLYGTYEGVGREDGKIQVTKVLLPGQGSHHVGDCLPYRDGGWVWMLQPEACVPTPPPTKPLAQFGKTYVSEYGTYEGVGTVLGKIRITRSDNIIRYVGDELEFQPSGWKLKVDACEPQPIVGQLYKSGPLGTYIGEGQSNGMVRITKILNSFSMRRVGECVPFDASWQWKPYEEPKPAPHAAVLAHNIIPGKLYKSMPSGDFTAVALHGCDANGHRKMMLIAVSNPLMGKLGSTVSFPTVPWRAL